MVAATVDRFDRGDDLDLDTILAADARAREFAAQEIEKRAREKGREKSEKEEGDYDVSFCPVSFK